MIATKKLIKKNIDSNVSSSHSLSRQENDNAIRKKWEEQNPKRSFWGLGLPIQGPSPKTRFFLVSVRTYLI
jgi:hypothetical protein